MRPTVARSGVGARVGVDGAGATGVAAAVGETVTADVGGAGAGDGDVTGSAVGDGLGEIGAAVAAAVGGGSVGGAVEAGVAGNGVSVVAAAAGAAGVDVEAARGAAATAVAVGPDGIAATVGTGLSAAGGGRVGTSTLDVSAALPLHAASDVSTSTRHAHQTAALARDLARVGQRRTVILNSRRQL